MSGARKDTVVTLGVVFCPFEFIANCKIICKSSAEGRGPPPPPKGPVGLGFKVGEGNNYMSLAYVILDNYIVLLAYIILNNVVN